MDLLGCLCKACQQGSVSNQDERHLQGVLRVFSWAGSGEIPPFLLFCKIRPPKFGFSKNAVKYIAQLSESHALLRGACTCFAGGGGAHERYTLAICRRMRKFIACPYIHEIPGAAERNVQLIKTLSDECDRAMPISSSPTCLREIQSVNSSQNDISQLFGRISDIGRTVG